LSECELYCICTYICVVINALVYVSKGHAMSQFNRLEMEFYELNAVTQWLIWVKAEGVRAFKRCIDNQDSLIEQSNKIVTVFM